jgi:hypothetical protein
MAHNVSLYSTPRLSTAVSGIIAVAVVAAVVAISSKHCDVAQRARALITCTLHALVNRARYNYRRETHPVTVYRQCLMTASALWCTSLWSMDSPVLVCLFEETLINTNVAKYLPGNVSTYALFKDLCQRIAIHCRHTTTAMWVCVCSARARCWACRHTATATSASASVHSDNTSEYFIHKHVHVSSIEQMFWLTFEPPGWTYHSSTLNNSMNINSY